MYSSKRYEKTRGDSIWQSHQLPWESLLSRLAFTTPVSVKNFKSSNTRVTYPKFAKGRKKQNI